VDVSGKAICRYDIEPYARNERHAQLPCLSIELEGLLKNRDLARNVEVVDPFLEASLDQRPCCLDKRPCRVQHGLVALERGIQGLWVVKRRDAKGQPEPFGKGAKLFRVSSGKDRLEPPFGGFFGHQPPRKPVRPV